jgi:hypothetical protein
MKEICIAEVVENTINHCHGNAVMVYWAICGNTYNSVVDLASHLSMSESSSTMGPNRWLYALLPLYSKTKA